MRRFSRSAPLFLLFLMLLFGGVKAKAQDINFCSFPLSKAILQAHASFNVIYEFDVDQQGVPVNVRPVAKQFTNLGDVQACLAKWRLPQSVSTHLVATFEWVHGAGWSKLVVSGPNIKLTVHLTGSECPYCAGDQVDAKPSNEIRKQD